MTKGLYIYKKGFYKNYDSIGKLISKLANSHNVTIMSYHWWYQVNQAHWEIMMCPTLHLQLTLHSFVSKLDVFAQEISPFSNLLAPDISYSIFFLCFPLLWFSQMKYVLVLWLSLPSRGLNERELKTNATTGTGRIVNTSWRYMFWRRTTNQPPCFYV